MGDRKLEVKEGSGGSIRDRYDQQYTQEQQKVQKGKFQGRLIDEYNQSIFQGRDYKEPRTSHTEEFINNYCGTDVGSLEELFTVLYSRNGRSVNWVDMGGGRGLAMRQLARSEQFREMLSMTNVDLLEYSQDNLTADEKKHLEDKFPGILNKQTLPHFIKANVETVKLPQKPDMITSIESIQYYNNPLAAICNWYNQLADNGVLIIAAEHEMSGWIRYEGSYITSDPHPMEPFLELLENNQIPFAIGKDTYIPRRDITDLDKERRYRFTNFIIQKKPNTSLILQAAVKNIWVNPHDYKAVYYDPNGPVIEIGDSSTQKLDLNYFEQMVGAFQKRNEI